MADPSARTREAWRAEQRRDMQPVGVCVGENNDFAVTQAVQRVTAGVDADRNREIMDLLRGQHRTALDFPGIKDLAS